MYVIAHVNIKQDIPGRINGLLSFDTTLDRTENDGLSSSIVLCVFVAAVAFLGDTPTSTHSDGRYL
jgi:hypothetical protein